MGYREIMFRLPAGYSEEELEHKISKKCRCSGFKYRILSKSLDARKKNDINWLLRVSVISKQIRGGKPPKQHCLEIPYKKRNEKMIVVGNGPAGFFCSYVLLLAGYDVTVIERGKQVGERSKSIALFEKEGEFDPEGNYAFGEGGAGTFSDGKLTARTKNISAERQFIISRYIKAGAPQEIEYLKHPHLGSDNLKIIVKNLRKEFIRIGGKIHFGSTVKKLNCRKGKVLSVETESDEYEADIFIFATGNSAYDTYKMLIEAGAGFRPKSFAIGSRIEHPQELINLAQWGVESLEGVKAAEYRLTFKSPDNIPVYTFCMCPGGIIVPSAAYSEQNIVNGMSRYARNGEYANAACVAAVDPSVLTGGSRNITDILDGLRKLEEKFYQFSGSYRIPGCSIDEFINKRTPASAPVSSCPSGTVPAPLWELLPATVVKPLTEGLIHFPKKLKGFEKGNISGLESKTSSPVQAVREAGGKFCGFDNLYICGEGSGYSGGIISSGVDGIRTAVSIIS